MEILQIIEWIWLHWWQLIALFILIRYWNRIYRDLVFAPMAGLDNKVQMDELAKGVILLVFMASATVEAFRKSEYHIFSDAYYFSLLGTVALIAGIKHGVQLLKKGSPKEEEKP
jgi:hypothetical protein